MSKVLVDSWGISQSLWSTWSTLDNLNSIYHYVDSSELQICRQNLLTSLVIWDDIYLNSDISNSGDLLDSRQATLEFSKMLGQPSFIHTIPVSDETSEAITLCKVQLFEVMKNFILNNSYHGEDEPDIWYQLYRSIIYLTQANNLGITYLPHPFRANFLQSSGIFKRKIDGRTYLDIIDKEFHEYIEAINELAQFQLLSTSFPVFYRFISKIAKDPLDEFKVALDLRKDKNVSLFRESVNEISEELNKGNLHTVRASLMKTKEICDEITDSLYKKPLSFGVSLGLSPSIEIDHNGTPKVASGFHTTFLSDLANFALKGDMPERYMFDD